MNSLLEKQASILTRVILKILGSRDPRPRVYEGLHHDFSTCCKLPTVPSLSQPLSRSLEYDKPSRDVLCAPADATSFGQHRLGQHPRSLCFTSTS